MDPEVFRQRCIVEEEVSDPEIREALDAVFAQIPEEDVDEFPD